MAPDHNHILGYIFGVVSNKPWLAETYEIVSQEVQAAMGNHNLPIPDNFQEAMTEAIAVGVDLGVLYVTGEQIRVPSDVVPDVERKAVQDQKLPLKEDESDYQSPQNDAAVMSTRPQRVCKKSAEQNRQDTKRGRKVAKRRAKPGGTRSAKAGKCVAKVGKCVAKGTKRDLAGKCVAKATKRAPQAGKCVANGTKRDLAGKCVANGTKRGLAGKCVAKAAKRGKCVAKATKRGRKRPS